MKSLDQGSLISTIFFSFYLDNLAKIAYVLVK